MICKLRGIWAAYLGGPGMCVAGVYFGVWFLTDCPVGVWENFWEALIVFG